MELGGALFERSTRAMTPLGKKLRPHFENAIATVQEIENRAKAYQKRAKARPRDTASRWRENSQRFHSSTARSGDEMR
jgi:DNA-binding transcriptional LysR family regulator